MSVNITNINELLQGEKAGAPSSWSNMGRTEQNSCHNFKIAGVSECNDVPATTLFLEIDAFGIVDYQRTVKSIELSPGKDLTVWKSKDPRVNIVLYGDEELHNLLQLIESSETITFTNLTTNQEEEISSMEIVPSEEGALLQLKITLAFKDAETVTTICCGSYYEDAPFNECDGEGQTGEPNNDPDCSEYAVTIAFTDDPDTLTASTVGGNIDDPETFKWYLDGVLFGEGASINPVLSGVYRVDARKGNCTDSESFTYSEPCEGYEVAIVQMILDDGTIILIATPNMISTIQWQEEIDTVWTDITGETDLMFEPDHSGNYRAVGTTPAECTAESNDLDVEVGTDCTDLYTLSIANVAGTLEVTINDYEGEGTPAYQWFLDSGSGMSEIEFTGATVPNATPGYYTAFVTIDGCTQAVSLLVQCTPEAGSGGGDCGTDFYQEFSGDDVSIAFNVTNFVLPDPAFYSEIQIESMLIVDRQGLLLRYAATPTGGNEYSIDYASQEIRLHAGFPLETGDTLGVRKINRT